MSLVRHSFANGVMTITLADTERRNALSADLTNELSDAIDEAEGRADVRVIVMTNEGTTFCAGANLSDRSVKGSPRAPVDPMALFGRFRHSPKPYVGRIKGHCVAGGMGLAAAMDISVAVDTAKFGFTEVRVGVAPAMISVLCLPKIRPVDARAAFLRGHRFSAGEAARMGLITEVASEGDLDRKIDDIVADLLAGAPGAIAASKTLLARVPTMSETDAFAWTAELSAGLFRGEEAREGISAFLEKRPASWVPPSDTGDVVS